MKCRFDMQSKHLILSVVVALAGFLPQSKADLVPLGTAGNFAILGGTAVTFTSPMTTVTGDVGVSPGTSITGGPLTLTGTSAIHNNDGVAAQAQLDLTTAYNAAAALSATAIPNSLGSGQTLSAGVYKFVTPSDPTKLDGALTLSGPGLFIFQVGADLQTTISSSVVLSGGAQACHVFWQVGSSANLLGPNFEGTILALTSITLGAGVTVDGRLLARNGLVSLIGDTITVPTCSASVPVPEPSTLLAGAFCVSVFGWQWLAGWRRKAGRS
jgi:hypothetical protein